ncbi:MAG: hypothetical protein AABZ53_12470 [Planctomycetota bacterium]
MALFGKMLGGGSEGPEDYSYERAEKFYEHARTAHDTGNFEYAAQHWLNAMRQDPRPMPGLEGLFKSMQAFLASPLGRKGISKETVKAISGKSDVDRYVMAVLEWSVKVKDVSLAVRAAELAGKCQAGEAGVKVADSAFRLATEDPKPKKDILLRLSEAYIKLGAPDKSLQAAERALAMDTSDGDLAAKIRSLAAAATMQKGGYEQAGQEGGFRSMVRDADKQKKIAEGDSIVRTDEQQEVKVVDAAADYEKRPTDQFAIEKYVTELLKRGKGEDEERARSILLKGYEDTQQVRFRLRAGDIRIRQSARKLVAFRHEIEKHPDDEDAKRMYEQMAREHYEMEVVEYNERVKAYPTDMVHKYELAKRYFALDRFEDAIGLLQEARNDPKHRGHVMNFLGQSFYRLNFLPEAVATFREAADIREASPELAMELRYWLMMALRKVAETEGDLAAAEEALKIASGISMQQFNYKDIRLQREALGKLVQSMKNK